MDKFTGPKSIIRRLRLYPEGRIEAFHVNGLGIREKMKPGMVHRPRGTNDYLFMHFHTPVQALVKNAMRALPCHSFIIWRPGAPQYFGNLRKSWLHSWIHCYGKILEAAVKSARLLLDEPVQFSDARLAERYLLAISTEIGGHVQPDDVILENLLEIWIRQISRHIAADAHPPIPTGILAARSFLERQLAGPVRLSDVAFAVHLSASHLSAGFKRCFGVSPMRYLLQLRLKAAAYRLNDVNNNISETAYAVGFRDALYFSRQFKRFLGVSPRVFRQGLTKRFRGARRARP